ncbi:unnamed protein product [Camellia sinensis]
MQKKTQELKVSREEEEEMMTELERKERERGSVALQYRTRDKKLNFSDICLGTLDIKK